MRLSVIGGYGLLGATGAFVAGCQGLFDEIALIGRKEALRKSHVMDMDQAMRPLSQTRIVEGQYADLHQSDVILLAVGSPEQAVDNRNEYLSRNVHIIKEVAAMIKDHCQNKVILCATNPIDVFTAVLFREIGWDKRYFLGFGYNDTLRLRWALAEETGHAYEDFTAYVLGEHGDMQAPLLSNVLYKGKPFLLAGDMRTRVSKRITEYFRAFQSLNAGRTSGWTSAVGIATVLRAIVHETQDIVPCSVITDGAFGLPRDVSVGLPLRLCHAGVKEIVPIAMNEEERARLFAAAEAIREKIALCV